MVLNDAAPPAVPAERCASSWRRAEGCSSSSASARRPARGRARRRPAARAPSGRPSTAPRTGAATLAYVDYGHPVFELFRGPRSGDFSSARFFRYRPLEREGGRAGAVRRRRGGPGREDGRARDASWSGRASLDTSWNDLALQPVFLPFLHQLVRHAAEPRGVAGLAHRRRGPRPLARAAAAQGRRRPPSRPRGKARACAAGSARLELTAPGILRGAATDGRRARPGGGGERRSRRIRPGRDGPRGAGGRRSTRGGRGAGRGAGGAGAHHRRAREPAGAVAVPSDGGVPAPGGGDGAVEPALGAHKDRGESHEPISLYDELRRVIHGVRRRWRLKVALRGAALVVAAVPRHLRRLRLRHGPFPLRALGGRQLPHLRLRDAARPDRALPRRPALGAGHRRARGPLRGGARALPAGRGAERGREVGTTGRVRRAARRLARAGRAAGAGRAREVPDHRLSAGHVERRGLRRASGLLAAVAAPRAWP